MRSTAMQVISGKVLGTTGNVVRGKMSCQRTGVGFYVLRTPPGKKLIDLIVAAASASYVSILVDQETDTTCRVVIANAAGTVNADCDFRYIATLAA